MRKLEVIRSFLKTHYPLIYDEIKVYKNLELSSFFEGRIPDIENIENYKAELDIIEEEIHVESMEHNEKDGFDKNFTELELLLKHTHKTPSKNIVSSNTNNESWFTKHFLEIFAIIILLLASTYFGVIITHREGIKDYASITEFIKNLLLIVVTFYFSSSLGSKNKSKSIDNILDNSEHDYE